MPQRAPKHDIPYEMCDFCSTLKYLLHHKVLKICVDNTLFHKFCYKVVHLNI